MSGNGERSSEARVREATLEDAGAIHALACELADAVGDARPAEEAVRDRLRELLDEPRARVIVAEESGVSGAASIWIKADLAHGDTVVEVPMLAVASEARRRGVGSLLVEKIRRTAAENGASIIELVATRDNAPARAFYSSLGFVETDHVSLEFVGDMEDPPDPEEG
jgi:ribosomal protein S18 acetylase RimI-like enzyme